MLWFLIPIFIILITFAIASVSGAPFVPSKKEDVSRFLELAEIKDGETVVDLGCGDGRFVFASLEHGAGARGYEISLIPFIFAKIQQLFDKKKRTAKIYFKNFWKADVSDVDIVYVFLMPDKMGRLRKKMEEELPPGARVITYVWPVKGWGYKKVDRQEEKPALYLYTIDNCRNRKDTLY
ncbi:MAG: hypothetical protein ABII02_01125 [Candidatus Magasanikbacteria bacterium]